MNLYNIKEDMLLLFQELEDLEEDSPEYTTALANIEKSEGEFEEKAKNLAAYLENVKVDVSAMKGYEHKMRDRRKVLENHYKKLKEYLLHNMQQTGINKIKCPEFDISLRKTPARVVIDAPNAIDKQYIASTEIVFDKMAIKKAIKSGDGVFGAHLETSEVVVIK